MISNPKWRRRIIRLFCAGLLAVALGWFVLPFAMPLPERLAGDPVASPVLLDRHGAVIRHVTLADSSRAAPVPLDDVPADLIACTLAAEDKRFYQHGGVDLLATLRAARDFLLHRRVVSGASTITQQLVKISSPPARRGPFTKIREALVARRLEMTWSKKQILTAYLNRLDYGNLRIGSAEAARFYFQKPLADLSLAECALLAGLPQAPSRLNPLRHPQRAVVRRNTVLGRLGNAAESDPVRIRAALAESLVLRPLQDKQTAPWLERQLQDLGFKSRIQTTLDLPLQTDVENIVREETAKLKDANLRHAAVVIIHNPTGQILALVSSADWNDPRGGQLNGALTPRSPGSTLKPFTYLLAMERNHRTPASILADIPSPFRTPQGLDLPENYDRQYRGPVTLRAALACSLNVPALREMNQLGGPQALHHLLVDLGITTLGADPLRYGLGLTLGNAPVRLLELTNAYATLARQGRHQPPVLFLPSTFDVSSSMFDVRSAYLIADILSDSQARAPSFQPGGPLDLPFRCAVKTGTSSDFHDNWCIGYTPEFTVGVWAGNFEHQPMKGLSGIAGAGPVFHRAMLRVHRDVKPTWYEKPAGLREVSIDPRNGKLVPADAKYSRRDIVPADDPPAVATAADYDPEGRALLDPTYAGWFAGGYNSRRGELALDASQAVAEPLRVISPAPDATYLLDPEIPSGSDRLRPVTNLPGVARWHSDTLRIEPGIPEPVIHLTAGTHILTVTDPSTGATQRLTLRVKSL
ncbi:penicillin-binding protein 1C [Luteolibacter yonseiensis]|uniref:peptidoglycan glycosyltransferase n=1 Tax=Luteolibacter yonseiensis TaxID=1144680 RepID=A0A934VAK9_9BACT|nr:penicillin-binding protein 1C [Luteolibacter yonseiensis]MBK1814971.1 penicillin-binding protein 1C [Luteolibacter yonseiensis]